MNYTEEQYWPQLIDLAQTIDTLDYFQILNLNQDANDAQIRSAYYQMARTLHPDRFYQIQNQQLKTSVTKIFKRITESYSILKDFKKKKIYLSNINGAKRAELLRYTEASERQEQAMKRNALELAKTPQGKKLIREAKMAADKKQWSKALQNVQSAMIFEMGNAEIKAYKAELEQLKKDSE